MKTSRWFLIIFFLYLAGYISHSFYLNKTVYGDGVFYYSWIRSIVVDHDIDFQNEYSYFKHSVPGNKYTIGPPLFWATDFLWTHAISNKTGFEFNYQFIIGLDGVLAAITGLVLLFRILRNFYSESISVLVTTSIALATNLFFYGSLDTVNSHAVSFLAATIFLNVLFFQKKTWFLIGLTLGFVGLMRTQDLIYTLVLIPYIKKINWKLFSLGVLIGFSPQLIAWQAINGSIINNPYLSEGFNFLHSRILEVLFSPNNGLFFWTPMLALGFVGLMLSKYNWLKITIFAQIFLVSTWSMWWQGASYSGRMFVSMLPLFALGLGKLYTMLWNKGWRQLYFYVILIAPLTIFNMLFIVYFLLIT